MKAKELRIGNLIGLDLSTWSDNVFNVLEVAEKSMKVEQDGEIYYFDADLLEPIPITEEWLLEFGFVKNHYSTDGVQYNEPFYHIELEAKGWRFGYNDDFGWVIHTVVSDYNVIPLKYVHQLQNLYFALTGNELTPLNIEDK